MLICIDPGHGGTDPGAIGFGVKEKDIALRVAKKLAAVFFVKGIDVVMTRDVDEKRSLSERVRAADHANLFVSIHCNADADSDTDPGQEASGFEVLVYKQPSIYAERILREVARIQTPTRGVKVRPDLYVLRNTQCPAVLVELGFIDSRHDHQLLVDDWHQWLLALALAEALSV